jgi:Phophatidylserine decarboxylase
VKTVEKMLGLFNHVMTHAPEYKDTGLVGFPVNAILDRAMGTKAGRDRGRQATHWPNGLSRAARCSSRRIHSCASVASASSATAAG